MLTLLSRFSIQRGDWQRAKDLANAALQAATTDETRALALTLLARAHHAQGNFNDAFRSYQQVRSPDSQSRAPSMSCMRTANKMTVLLGI